MQKPKVFLSSRMTELHDARVSLHAKLISQGYDVIWFEGFPARPESAESAYLEGVRECDVYVGVFWNQYSEAVVQEYFEAQRRQKPCFIYSKSYDIKRESRLQDFLAELERST